MSADKKFRWFIIHVFTGQEKIICKYLAEQKKKKRILIHAAEDDAVTRLIAESPKVMGFLGKKAAQPITEEEAEKILGLMETVEEVNDTRFLEGQTIRIIDGPFTDFNGSIKELNREKERLIVMVTVFGRSTPVELSYNQVELI
jgi:transcriptional antiterminator NusG